MITASTKLYKRKRQLEGEAQSSSDSDDTEDSGGKFKCVRLVNTIVLVNVKIGRGASATTHPCQFRVTALYDKWYNKYVMSKEPFKRWKNERQHNYKLDVRMLEKDILGQLSDVSLVGNSIYRST